MANFPNLDFILPGETDAFDLRLAAGRRYSFRTTARELQPYIGDAVPGFFNPILTLRDAQGATVAVADDESRFRPDPVVCANSNLACFISL